MIHGLITELQDAEVLTADAKQSKNITPYSLNGPPIFPIQFNSIQKWGTVERVGCILGGQINNMNYNQTASATEHANSDRDSFQAIENLRPDAEYCLPLQWYQLQVELQGCEDAADAHCVVQ